MSSSESEDENIKRFLEAADTTLINDAMFQGISAKTQSEPKQGKQCEHSGSKGAVCCLLVRFWQ